MGIGGRADRGRAAIAGTGIVYLFEDWLRQAPRSQCRSRPVLEPWWQRASDPFLYYPGRRTGAGTAASIRRFRQGGEERFGEGAGEDPEEEQDRGPTIAMRKMGFAIAR